MISFLDRFQASLKPAGDMAELGAHTLSQLVNQQNALLCGLLRAGLGFSQALSRSSDPFDLLQAQQRMLDKVQGKVLVAVNESSALVAGAQEQAGEILGGAMAEPPRPTH